MKIENLKEGQEIKNYKMMCEVLDIKTTTGNAKKAQLKELERFIKYHKKGNKFVVDEIYSEPLPAVENLKNNKYGIYIENLILHMLTNCPIDKKTKTISMSRNGLYLMLHMINNNYNIGRNNINLFSRYLNIPTATVYDFYNGTSIKMKSAVERTLNKLKNQCLIDWEYRTSVKLRSSGIIRNATDEEYNIILEIEREALTSLKCKNKQEIFIKGKWNDFQELIHEALKDTNIMYYFKIFYIHTTKDFRDMLLNEIELMENQGELNAELYLSTIETAKKHNKKMNEKFKDNNPKFENEKCALIPEYIESIKKIAEITLSEKYPVLDIEELKEHPNEKYLFEEYIYNNIEHFNQPKYISEIIESHGMPF